jgi:hypothetical protein
MSTPFPEQRPVAPPVTQAASAFVPLLMFALTITAWFAFQTVALWRERETLATARSAQEKSVEDARKMRTALDQLARGTAVLAEKGNANAKLVVDELRRRGITINPNSPPAN